MIHAGHTIAYKAAHLCLSCFQQLESLLLQFGVLRRYCVKVETYSSMYEYVLVLFLSMYPSLAFSVWQYCLITLQKSDNSWGKSGTYHVTTFYLQPLLLWTGAMLVCRLGHSMQACIFPSRWLIYFLMASWCMKYISYRALEPMVLPTEASQIVKQRLLNFIKSLSTVLAFAYCLSR